MLTRPDAQSYTRFLASLGLFLCVAAITVPVLAFRDTSVLRISSAERGTLTAVAQREVDRRQEVSRIVGNIVFPWGAGAVLVLGLLLLGGSLPELRKQEKKDGRRTDFELQKAELEAQTDAEVEAGALEEAASEVSPAKRVPLASDASGSRTVRRFGGTVAELASRHREIEKQVLERIAEITPPSFVFHPQVKVDGSTTLRLDGVLRPKDRRSSDIVIGVKVTSRKNFVNRVDAAAARAIRFQSQVDPKARSWLILIGDAEDARATDSQFVARVADDFKSLLTVTLVAEPEIDSLAIPAHLMG